MSTSTSTNSSPLEQVTATSLEEIFNTDPNLFSGPDDPKVVLIVQALRADRARWIEDEKKPKATKAKAAKTAVQADLKLEDLDL